MEKQENKYPFLSEYLIKTIKEETKEQILERVNSMEENNRRKEFQNHHYGDANIIVYKDGKQVQSILLNEADICEGFTYGELKSIAQDLENLYQDYESKTVYKIILTSEWDETEQTNKTNE
jgi:hypothetical protein